MDLWKAKSKGGRTVAWTAELEAVFAVFCRKHAFDFGKVSRCMVRYVANMGNDTQTRLVDPFLFTPEVCRVHWAYRDFLKRKAFELMPEPIYSHKEELRYTFDVDDSEAMNSEVMTKFNRDEADDVNSDDLLLKLMGRVKTIMANDSTQPKETPTISELKDELQDHDDKNSELALKTLSENKKEEKKKEINKAAPLRNQVESTVKRMEWGDGSIDEDASERSRAAAMRRKMREERRKRMMEAST